MIARENPPPRQPWIGALVSVLLVLGQVLAPLHLALNDHIAVGGAGGHVHSRVSLAQGEAHHGEPGHRHGSAREAGDLAGEGSAGAHGHVASRHGEPSGGDSGAQHRPHPAEDHLDQLMKPVVLPDGPPVLFAFPAEERLQLVFDRPALEPAAREGHVVRPPPPRTAFPSRAPPIAV